MGDSSVCTSSSARTLVLPAISGRPEIMQSPRWALTRRKVARACGLAQRGSLMLMSNGDDLDPATFRNSLRNLGVKLTPVELGALFRAFDVNGDGTVGAAEFAKALYDMGRVERRQQIKSERAANARCLGKVHRREAYFAEKHRLMALVRVADRYSTRDRDRALRKIEAVAANWEPPPRGPPLTPFTEGGPLSTSEFWHELRAVFNVVLDPEELAAMMDFFDSDGSGAVDGAEFASRFFRLSSEMRRARLEKERRDHEARLDRDRANRAVTDARYYTRTLASVPDDYSEEDEASALEKIAKVARGTLTGATAPELRPFKEGAYLDATALRHYLRSCFRVKLTPPELAALVGILDQSGDGLIDAGEFLNCFYKIVRREQANHVREKFRANAQRAQSEVDLQDKFREITERCKQIKVVWPKDKEAEDASQGTVVKVSDDVADFLDDIDRQWAKAERKHRKSLHRATVV